MASGLARVYQFAKLHLFAPNSGMYGCPLAMTDGAAKLMESLLSARDGQNGGKTVGKSVADGKDKNLSPRLRAALARADGQISSPERAYISDVFDHLTSASPEQFWTSGQ